MREELSVSDDELCIGCVGNLTPVKDYRTTLLAVEALDEPAKGWRLRSSEKDRSGSIEVSRSGASAVEEPSVVLGIKSPRPGISGCDGRLCAVLRDRRDLQFRSRQRPGTPVIATAVGGNPEVVIDGHTWGYCLAGGLQPAKVEQLHLLRERPDLRVHLAQQARRRVREEFSIDLMNWKYQDTYEGMTMRFPVRVEAAVYKTHVWNLRHFRTQGTVNC